MTLGVPLIDEVRTARLVDWFYQQQLQDFHKTMLLVAAARDVEDISKYLENYRQSVLPTKESNEKMMEKHLDFIQEELQKEYTVEWEPSEIEKEFL